VPTRIADAPPREQAALVKRVSQRKRPQGQIGGEFLPVWIL